MGQSVSPDLRAFGRTGERCWRDIQPSTPPRAQTLLSAPAKLSPRFAAMVVFEGLISCIAKAQVGSECALTLTTSSGWAKIDCQRDHRPLHPSRSLSHLAECRDPDVSLSVWHRLTSRGTKRTRTCSGQPRLLPSMSATLRINCPPICW